ncbi:MAG: DNA-binding protein [Clostridiales bacterium]|jgi:predicted DNA-binding protein YlxM (UPF0122 family)|nr:DNA-binding protein [Clostridia bacterium]MCR4882023.1 DNA-binding protein [Clostridiales bacterium]
MAQETPEFLQRKVELAYLAAFYSGLLTDKQKEVLSMYCEEDMSLGEIARETGVSRQGVSNVLNRSAEKLFHLEESLGTAERFRVMLSGLQKCRNLLREEKCDEAIMQLDTLIQLYTEEDGYGL